MRKQIGLILFCCVLFSCKKESDTIPVSYDRYKIYLSDEDTITRLERYINDTLIHVKMFRYNTQEIAIDVTDKKGELISKSTYFLNGKNLADSCINIIYRDSKLLYIYLYINKYHPNGYLQSTDRLEKDTVDGRTLSELRLDYHIKDGNYTAIDVQGVCLHNYTFYEIESRIDIFTFLGDFNGKWNKNLLKSFQSGCHPTPSTTPPKIEYEYSLDSLGWVTERVENYYSSYHTSDKGPDREKRITTFEYIFQ